jgi:RNA polymerase sigma-70 factor (ECF subfamily)
MKLAEKRLLGGVFSKGSDGETGRMGKVTPELLGVLLDRHGAALVLYAQQWCNTPEDVVQEAFVALVRQGEPPANPAGWLYRVVRNGAIAASRSAARRYRREAAVAHRGEPCFEPNPGDRLDALEAARALAELPIHERETMVARLWGGLSFDEIAGLTGSSTSTVYRWYQQGLVALRERLKVRCPTKRTDRKT